MNDPASVSRDGYRAIWSELFTDQRPERGHLAYKPSAGPFTAEDAAHARRAMQKYARTIHAAMMEYDDGEFLVFGLFVGLDPDPNWMPDLPRKSWSFSEGDASQKTFRPEWDPEMSARLLGSYVLVGITTVGGQGEKTHEQAHGRVVSADRDMGITIACEGVRAGRQLTLPPCTNTWHEANPVSIFTLKSTGERVQGVLFTTTWERSGEDEAPGLIEPDDKGEQG